MTTNKEIQTALTLEEMFYDECQTINLKYEYPGYTGKEKFGIITSLSKEELQSKYMNLLLPFSPFIVLDDSFKTVRNSFIRNEKKHYARAGRGNVFDLSDEFEEHHPELAVKDCLETVIANEDSEELWKAINTLDYKQKSRLISYFFDGMTYREIAEIEGVNHRAINRSVEVALKKLSKILICYPQKGSPSGNK